MPRNTEKDYPVKLRVHVGNEMHQQLIQLCGLHTLEEGRMVSMSEVLRGLLEKGVKQELCHSAGK